MEATADDSLAAMRARSKFGIAIAAMIRMMATTISSSISEKPFCCFRISLAFPQSFLNFDAYAGHECALILHVTRQNGNGTGYGRVGWKPFVFSDEVHVTSHGLP